jgi:hypothetical protein
MTLRVIGLLKEVYLREHNEGCLGSREESKGGYELRIIGMPS